MKHWTPQITAANDQPDLNEHRLLLRLREQLANIRMPNCTAAADAVHVALVADQRAAGMPTTALNSLTRDQIVVAVCNLKWEIERGTSEPFKLPFGTDALAPTRGTLKIGNQRYVLDASRPGLHAVETVRRDAHGANLEMLTASIARKTKKLAVRRLGAPIPVTIFDSYSGQWVQFAPLPEAGNVVLRRKVDVMDADRFCSALPQQIEALAKSIVENMRSLWNRRTEIGARVDEVRAAAIKGLAEESGLSDWIRVQAIAIDMNLVGDYPASVYIDYRAYDEALRPGTVIDFVPGTFALDGHSWPSLRDVRYRGGMRHRLADLGATGMIDEVAEAVAKAAPEGLGALLATLSVEQEVATALPTPTGPLHATLFWRDGVIQAELSKPGKLEWYDGRVEIEGDQLPETILDSLPGRAVSSIVALPFATDVKIKEVDVVDPERFRLRIEPVEKMVNCSTGQVWLDADVDSFDIRFG